LLKSILNLPHDERSCQLQLPLTTRYARARSRITLTAGLWQYHHLQSGRQAGYQTNIQGIDSPARLANHAGITGQILGAGLLPKPQRFLIRPTTTLTLFPGLPAKQTSGGW
jgi:hypothetical protein